MERKSKVILGLKYGRDFSESERIKIIQDYKCSGKTKKEIWYKYTGQQEEHGQIGKWMRNFESYGRSVIRSTFATKQNQLKKQKNINTSPEDSFENLQLKKRILELERQLKEAELKAIAFSTMVDIAEKEFKIPIRKKYNTKP
jgi:transposase-like protein